MRTRRAVPIRGGVRGRLLFTSSDANADPIWPESPLSCSRIEKGTVMRRSFRYPESSQLDLAVDLSLGLAALMAVLLSLGATFDFCSRLDRITAWFCNDSGSAEVSDTGQPERRSLTNAAGAIQPSLQPDQPPQTDPPSGSAGAPGGEGPPTSDDEP